MTLSNPLWLQNHQDYNAADARAMITGLWSAGVVSGMAVSQASPTPAMSVQVAAGGCVIEGTETAGQGSYLCLSDATESVAIAASPGSGQSRVDLIVATIEDSAVSGSNDQWVISAVTGTPSSGTPAVPALPASSIELARVTVGANVVSILDKDITDRRALAGALSSAGAPALRPSFNGQIMADDGIVYVAQSGSWVPVNAAPPPFPRFYSATAASWTMTGGQSDQTVCSVSVPAPGWPARITAHATATLDLATVPDGKSYDASYRVLVGGTPGAVCRAHRMAASTGIGTRTASGGPVAPSASGTIPGSSSTTVQLVYSTASTHATSGGSTGQLLVRVDPIDA